MKNLLEIEFETTMDANLVRTWVVWENYSNTLENWIEFLYTLPHIKTVSVENWGENRTIIEFDSEAHYTWFILRWS